jgi:hypothetical protein
MSCILQRPEICQTAACGIEDRSIHAQHLELRLLGRAGARPGHPPSLREEALGDVAADEAGAEHEHVPGPRLRRRGGGGGGGHRLGGADASWKSHGD